MQIIDNRFGTEQPVELAINRYANGNLALTAACVDDFPEPWATYSINPPDYLLGGYEIAIKDWSEGDGVPALLVREDIIHPDAVAIIPSGFVKIRVFTLTEKAIAAFGL